MSSGQARNRDVAVPLRRFSHGSAPPPLRSTCDVAGTTSIAVEPTDRPERAVGALHRTCRDADRSRRRESCSRCRPTSAGAGERSRRLRTDPRGRWRFRYRFGATLGRVTYRFRARLPREGGYPVHRRDLTRRRGRGARLVTRPSARLSYANVMATLRALHRAGRDVLRRSARRERRRHRQQPAQPRHPKQHGAEPRRARPNYSRSRHAAERLGAASHQGVGARHRA